jgi:hypothetical protein
MGHRGDRTQGSVVKHEVTPKALDRQLLTRHVAERTVIAAAMHDFRPRRRGCFAERVPIAAADSIPQIVGE